MLITTDVACRGIDIPDMDYVINYDLPDNPENYVHRCGRTGRGESNGQALSFCSPEEKILVEAIEEYTGEEILHYDITSAEYKDILIHYFFFRQGYINHFFHARHIMKV